MDCRHRPLFPHRLTGVILAVLLLGAACGSEDSEAADADSTPTSNTTATAPESETTPPTGDDVAETTTNDSTSDDASTFFPDVLAAEATRADDGTWTFAVTLSSPYDTPAQYADAWRVVDLDGTEYGVRVLTHDHANEQPFTRSQAGIEIPDGVTTVRIEGRDQTNGWGGTFLEFELPS